MNTSAKRLLRRLKGPAVGLLAGLMAWLMLGSFSNQVWTASAQEGEGEGEGEPEPTPEPTATVPPTPLPSLLVQAFTDATASGDVDGNGIVTPGDRVSYRVRVINQGGAATGAVKVSVVLNNTFIGNVEQVSNGGRAEGGTVIWNLEALPPGEEVNLFFVANLRRAFPPGRTQVTGSVLVTANAVRLAEAVIPSVEVVGPNLRLVDQQYVIITDAANNGTVDPGDTIGVTIAYQNSGGGPALDAAITVDYPEELTRDIVSNPNQGQLTEDSIIWLLGEVPVSTGQVESVTFSVQLTDNFTPGTVTYDLLITAQSGGATLDTRTLKVPITGANVVIAPRFEVVTDLGQLGQIDVGDVLAVSVGFENVGTEPAEGVRITGEYNAIRIEALPGIEPLNAPIIEAGRITFPLISLDPGASGRFVFQARVRQVPPEGEDLRLNFAVVSEQTLPTSAELLIPALPVVAAQPTAESLITETRLPQGQGILSGQAVSILVGGFLFFSLLAIVYVGSRVLPATAEERDSDVPEIRSSHQRMVRELVEGVVLTAILFSVIVLGLQNTLDQDSVNSIIAGIVGYVAGRVTSQR